MSKPKSKLSQLKELTLDDLKMISGGTSIAADGRINLERGARADTPEAAQGEPEGLVKMTDDDRRL